MIWRLWSISDGQNRHYASLSQPAVFMISTVLFALIFVLMVAGQLSNRQSKAQRARGWALELRNVLVSAGLCAILLLGFILTVAAGDFTDQWQTWYELRTANMLAQARVLTQECVARPTGILKDTLVTYQFEARLADSTRRIVTQKLAHNGGKYGCSTNDPIPISIAIRYDSRNPAIAGLANSPPLSELILASILGILGGLLLIAGGLALLLGGFNRRHAGSHKLAQEEQERHELETEGFRQITSPELQQQERRELEAEGFMQITDPDLKAIVERAVLKGSPITRYLARRDDRSYLSFGFIGDPYRRQRAWDLLRRYQAGGPIDGDEHNEVIAIQFEMLGDTALLIIAAWSQPIATRSHQYKGHKQVQYTHHPLIHPHPWLCYTSPT